MYTLAISLLLLAPTAWSDTGHFDDVAVGSLPPGWLGGATGKGAPRWTVERDDQAPSVPNVLKQSGKADYPWCVKPLVALTDGFVQVSFKAIAGKRDQAGGVVWRWKNGDNYYVARANALENNVSLYYVEGGIRTKIQYVDAPVAPQIWHTLRVEFSGEYIAVFLDGKKYIEQHQDRIRGSGAVGVWTKADSFTAFDDFSYGE